MARRRNQLLTATDITNFETYLVNAVSSDTPLSTVASDLARVPFRVTAGLEVVVRGASKDLHSGSYGGAVANPANVLARIIAACQAPFGRIAIPGFYDRVRPLEDWERAEFARLPFREEEFLAGQSPADDVTLVVVKRV